MVIIKGKALDLLGLPLPKFSGENSKKPIFVRFALMILKTRIFPISFEIWTSETNEWLKDGTFNFLP